MGASISYDPKPPGERRFVSKWSRDMARLAPHDGDLLEFYRSQEYSHWGLYLGNGKVVHFNPCSRSNMEVGSASHDDYNYNYSYSRSQSVQSNGDIDIDVFARERQEHLAVNKFVPGVVTIGELEDIAKMPGTVDKINKVRINNKPALRELPHKMDEIRSLALQFLDMTPGTLRYCSNLFNCEHFVTYLKFGRSFTETRWNNNVNGTVYDTKEVKRLFREVFLAQATGKPITVYDSQCYWIVHFMDRTRQQWEEYLRATEAGKHTQPKLLIEELHMEIEDFMYALEKTDLS